MTIPSKSVPVKRRAYNSERRRRQASRTRRDIVEAAQRLFEEKGYSAATMTAIAQKAGVAVETIYRGFDGKAGLLEEVVLAAVAGGARRAERPVVDRPVVKAISEQPDPRLKLRLYAGTQPGIWSRAGPLMRALKEAASGDPDLAVVLERLESQRLDGLKGFAQNLADTGALRTEMTVGEARDIIWALNSLAVHDLFIVERGWSSERYQEWLSSVMAASLLAPDGHTSAGS